MAKPDSRTTTRKPIAAPGRRLEFERAGNSAQAEEPWRKVKNRFPEEGETALRAQTRAAGEGPVGVGSRTSGSRTSTRLARNSAERLKKIEKKRRNDCLRRRREEPEGVWPSGRSGSKSSAIRETGREGMGQFRRPDRAEPTSGSGTCSPRSNRRRRASGKLPDDADDGAPRQHDRRPSSTSGLRARHPFAPGDPAENSEAEGRADHVPRRHRPVRRTRPPTANRDGQAGAGTSSRVRHQALNVARSDMPNRSASAAAFERARRVIPGGVNSPARAFGARRRHARCSSPAAKGRTSSTSTATATSTSSAPGGR